MLSFQVKKEVETAIKLKTILANRVLLISLQRYTAILHIVIIQKRVINISKASFSDTAAV